MLYTINRSVSVCLERMFLLSVIVCCICSLAYGEELQTKKAYTSDLDSLWSRNISIQCLSNDGKWIICTEFYGKKEGVAILMSSEDSISFKVKGGKFLAFSGDSNWFGTITPGNELMLYNLKDHTTVALQGINSYQFSPAGVHFAAIKSDREAGKSLLVTGLKDSTSVIINGVNEYVWNPENGIIAACLKDSISSQIILYNVNTRKRVTLLENKGKSYSRLIWSDSGNALVFCEQEENKHLLYCYNMEDSVIASVKADMDRVYPNSELMIRDLSVSDDGTTVIYSRGFKYDSHFQEIPEIWDTNDPWIYPRMTNFIENKRLLQLTAWDTRSGRSYHVTDEETPDARYNPNSRNALVYDRLVYEPQYKQDTDVDLFIKDFRTGEKHLISRKQYTYRGFVKLSPTGRYVAFFKENNWWVYDSETQRTVNLTRDLDLHFEKTDDAPEIDKEPYGNPGWSENEEYIILYDRYDIWLMTPDGSNRYRITQGREQQIQFRISLELIREDHDFIKSLAVPGSSVFKIKDGLILEMMGDDLKSGYAVLKENMTVETLVYSSGEVDGILMSYDQRLIVFKRSRFNNPPAIFVLDLVSKEIRLLYQSNEQLLDYDLGEAELVRIRDGKNGYLSGSLIYPARFNPEKKYPMIVWIYEKNARLVNSFTPPSDYEYAGFNILRYVTNGYFVLLPDIEYTIGAPGISALKTVTNLVNKVSENEFIDKKRIGLIGHSFGGYEAAFIATQTKLFRAVVAGAPITDLASWYHDIQGNGWDTEQMWRMENQQLRMGGSYYDLKRQYLKNSPLHNVEKLDTPIMLWAGKNDYNVNWYQSIYMFMAMKRLNKEGRLLLYNNEGHCMLRPENKQSLSEETFSWFGHHLKEGRSE